MTSTIAHIQDARRRLNQTSLALHGKSLDELRRDLEPAVVRRRLIPVIGVSIKQAYSVPTPIRHKGRGRRGIDLKWKVDERLLKDLPEDYWAFELLNLPLEGKRRPSGRAVAEKLRRETDLFRRVQALIRKYICQEQAAHDQIGAALASKSDRLTPAAHRATDAVALCVAQALASAVPFPEPVIGWLAVVIIEYGLEAFCQSGV